VITIWTYFFKHHLRNRGLEFYAGYWGLVLFSLIVGFGTVTWLSYFGLLFGLLAIFGWFFFVPAAIYLMDHDAKNNPSRPKTLANLLHILLSKRTE